MSNQPTAAHPASTKSSDDQKRIEGRMTGWYPDLHQVECANCMESTLGPWVPIGYGRYLCEVCHDNMPILVLIEWHDWAAGKRPAAPFRAV